MSIILDGLVKRFDRTLVVNNVSLEVNDGDLFVLLGGSGSGKSTILRMIAGLTQPDAGRIELDGRDVTFLPPQVRGTGFVFQNYSIFRHMTVAENVAFGLRIRRTPMEERGQRTEELLELVGLTGLGERYADQLSGGQLQRVALARALAYKPAVLLLDEPFGALDVKIRAQLRKSLRQIQQQLQVTTILVTHDQDEAFELADSIGVIERGRLVEVGNPEALYHRPHNEFTASFIGGGNVVVGRKKGDQIRLGEISLPFPVDAPAHEEGAPVRILFRPETVQIQSEPFSQEQVVVALGQGEVVEQTFVGSQQRTLMALDILRGVRPVAPPPAYGQARTYLAAVQPSQPDLSEPFRQGEVVWVGLENYHVLNPTGLKVLIHAEQSLHGESAVEIGCRLAASAAGPATIISVASSENEVLKAREWLEKILLSWQLQIPLLEMRIRQGSMEEIVIDAREGDYELVVLGQPRGSSRASLAAGFHQKLLQSGIAILFVQEQQRQINRILICTAGGEPGKSDVRFGGRIARRVGAAVTVYHAYRALVGPVGKQRVDRHLQLAKRSLEALGVIATVKAENGPVIERILHEAESGDYDLIVIGAPAPLAPSRIFQTDFASRILGSTTRPVLIVPMVE